MGVVYAAHDQRLDRAVALKRIRPGLGDGQERERLWREARAAASVNHPNVCQLYESEVTDGPPVIATFLSVLAPSMKPTH
jgi:serine/threonine protein kinase